MRKLFLLIPAMLLTMAMHADPIGPNVANTTVVNALYNVVNAASADAVIELSDGIYQEGNVIELNKNITIKAAEGAHPVIAQQCYFKLLNNAKITFQGIKFDGGLYPEHDGGKHANDHCLRSYDNSPTGTLTLDNCEFTRFPSYVIYAQKADRRWGAITIRNCYFYNNVKSAIYITNESGTNQSCNSLTIENSTFADMSTGGNYSVIYYNAPDAEHDAILSVNHCTFYNHPSIAIDWKWSSNVTIKNSIFAQPTTVSQYSVSSVAGSTIDYCLAYKTNGFSQASTNDRTGNPYFMNTNPANYDFTIWTTSPAHGTADDGEDMGDYLRWHTDPATHVSTVNITADDANSLKAAVDAALPGDEIILAAGTYEESESISLDKEITIKAAEGAHPVVKPVGNFALSNAADITIENIKFDGSDQSGVSNFIYADDATNNSLAVEGCEFYNFGNAVISATSSKLIGTCTVNNCQFYNNTHSCVGLKNSAAANLTVTNSTFNNIDASGLSDGIGIVESKTATGTMLVDHCTFYDCNVKNTDVGITKVASPNATVSNCIFAMPTSTSDLRTVYIPDKLDAGTTVTNCVMHHFTKDSNIGVPSRTGSVITNCNAADPLFINTATGFAVKGNWSTGEISPAREAATDGTCLGDPRWYTDEVLPSTNFASDYDLVGTKALLMGDVELNASSHIKYKGTATPGTVKWKMHVNNTCAISAVAKREAGSISGCTLTLTVYDADGNNVGALVAARSEDDNDINFPGTVYIPEEGDYTLVLTNSVSHSGAILEKIILSYAGGAVQTITNADDFVTDINEAWFSSNGTRADGKISFPGASMANAWARWNVHVSNNDYYDVTVNFDKGDADHNCGVKLYNDLTTVFDKHATTSSQTGAASPIRLGRFYLPAGDYVMEFTNPVTNSTAKLISVEAKAFVAPVIALPNTLPAASAITSELAYEDGGELYFTPSDRKGYILDQWVKWKVSVAAAGAFLFTMNVNSNNEQSYKITILDSENNELDFFEKNPGSGEQTIKHYFNLAAGNYFVMVQNTTNHSAGHIVSLVVTKPDDVVIIDEEATDNTSWSGYVVAPAAEGPLHDVQIKRTIVGGMYNTLCLPFEVTSAQAREIFGSDVQLRTLNEATIEEGGFVLNLDFTVTSSMYPGTPHLIKTSRDIVDPVFIGVKFTRTTPAATTKTKANFVGNFAAGTIEASENNLFLGAENTLYFPTQEIEILGMRAYFVVHDVPAYMIKRARIVENEQVITEIELVKSQEPEANNQKLLIDGQLIIVRDGVRYNVMGTKVQ